MPTAPAQVSSTWPMWGEGLAIYAGAVLVWALGLYVVTRGGWRPIPLLAGAATLALVGYQLGQALGALAPGIDGWLAWGRRTWWGAALAPALWLALVLALTHAEAPDTQRPRLARVALAVAPAAVALGGVFAVLGSATETVIRWDVLLSPQGPPHVPPGPLFWLYQAYVLGCLLGAVAALAALFRASPRGSPLRVRFGGLLVSGVLFLLCGAYITAASGLFGFSAVPGQALLSLGLAIMAWNLATYGALLAGEVVLGDFLAYVLAMGAVVLGYGLLLATFVPREPGWQEWVLPGVLLLMATHVLVDRENLLLDRALYGGVGSALRSRLRFLADRVVRQPDTLSALADVRESVDALVREQTVEPFPRVSGADGSADSGDMAAPSELRVLVEGALRRLNDLPALSEHPLLERVVPAEPGQPGQPVPTALQRAGLLRGELEAAIGRLRPSSTPRPSPGSPAGPGGWLHYLVLHEAYVEGRPNKQVMQRYHLSEGTFHRARRRAVDAVAEDLHQQHLGAR